MTTKTDSTSANLDRFLIPMARFGNQAYIEERVSGAAPSAAGSLRTALRYLYDDDGPVNLPRDRMKKAEEFFDEIERVVVRWLYTRTNGSLRKQYGSAALTAARKQRYRCESCGHADVRVLTLDHIEGRNNRELFACLCANCHMLKSRKLDWAGKAGA